MGPSAQHDTRILTAVGGGRCQRAVGWFKDTIQNRTASCRGGRQSRNGSRRRPHMARTRRGVPSSRRLSFARASVFVMQMRGTPDGNADDPSVSPDSVKHALVPAEAASRSVRSSYKPNGRASRIVLATCSRMVCRHDFLLDLRIAEQRQHGMRNRVAISTPGIAAKRFNSSNVIARWCVL